VSCLKKRTTRIHSTSLNLSSVDFQSELMTYFLQTCINVGVPTLAFIILIAFAAKMFRSRNDGDGMPSTFDGTAPVEEIYSDLFGETPSPVFPIFRRPPKKSLRNIGIPQETYIKVTKYNKKLNSYDYSLTSAIESKANAARLYRSQTIGDALKKVLPTSLEVTSSQRNELLQLEGDFLKAGGQILSEMQIIQKELAKNTIKRTMQKMDVKVGELDPEHDDKVIDVNVTVNVTRTNFWKKLPMMDANKRLEVDYLSELEKLNTDITRLELDFMKTIILCSGPEYANGVRAVMLGNIEGGNGVGPGSLLKFIQTSRPLESLLKESSSPKRLFFTAFPGDVTASQVAQLREEVTAIVRAAKPGDEALLVLQSGGGTVTGYGLGAAQLRRFKDAGMRLTICVEQVAASGGYLMSCVADKIIASPFAVLGSIGVITDIPNFYERLKQEGVEFQTITAGKYKRTLTPTKKPVKEDAEKTKKDLENILVLFKDFVKQNRPSIDIDSVATGETWFGDDALQKGLCDEIKTKDDVLLEYVDKGYDVFEVRYEPPIESPLLRLAPATKNSSWIRRGISWLISVVAEEMNENPKAYSYMMKDSFSANERIRIQD